MPEPPEEPWLDEAAGRLVRPYAVSNGRTKPSVHFDLLTLVVATGHPKGHLGPDHQQILSLCKTPLSVAEIAANIGQPAVVTKVLLADLKDCGAIATRKPAPAPLSHDPIDKQLLEAVLDGLRNRI